MLLVQMTRPEHGTMPTLQLDFESKTESPPTGNHSSSRGMYFLAIYGGRSIRYHVIFIANYLLLRAGTGTPRSEDMYFNLITGIGFKTSYTWNLTCKRFVGR